MYYFISPILFTGDKQMENLIYIKKRVKTFKYIKLIKDKSDSLYKVMVCDVVVYISKNYNKALSFYNKICFALNRTERADEFNV